MKIKSFLSVFVAAIIALGGTAFAQDAVMKGTVVAVAGGKITIQKGTEIWAIRQGPTTTVTGDLKVGSVVTIKYNAPDAQKKEEPLSNPTPTPASQ